MSKRQEKVASVIKRALAGPISDIASEYGKGLVTLTAVRMSPDLHNASLYISVYGSKETPAVLINEIESRKGELRQVVGREVRLRFVPDLRIYLDDTLDQMDRIQTLLNSAKVDELDGSDSDEEK